MAGQRAPGTVRQQPGGGEPGRPAAVPDGECEPSGRLPARDRPDSHLHLAVQVGACIPTLVHGVCIE